MHTARQQVNHDRIGVLLVNLGTPDSSKRADVRRYLKQFLSDRRVIETPRWLWWLILNCIILVARPRRTAKLYEKIWRADGSPLLIFSQRQLIKIRARLHHLGAAQFTVELGMRYGKPRIADALAKLQADGARKILTLPLYPQYCAATTAAAYDAVFASLQTRRRMPALRAIDDYHDRADYIAALAAAVTEHRAAHGDAAMLLMSFHGIPQSYADAGDPYAEQCKTTARLLAAKLNLDASQWRVAFQSRVGPQQWLKPYTDHTLQQLARDGARDVQVICPGFAADCLETLEEIAMQNRELFLQAGGKKFSYIQCLNERDDHIEMLCKLIMDNSCNWTRVC